MILTKEAIKKEIKKGKIKISPYNPRNIGSSSLDLTLDKTFWVFDKQKKITLNEKSDFKKYTKKIKSSSITLEPGGFIIGISKEKITLPKNICGILSGRSRFARFGIAVHTTAFLVHPGVSNHQVFEIKNTSNNIVTLKPGLKVAQLAFVRTEGESKYKGSYAKQ